METYKNHFITLTAMLFIAVGVVWIIEPGPFFQNIHHHLDDIVFSFLNTVVLGYGLGFIETKISISWVKAPFKRFLITVLVYMVFVFIMSNLIFLMEYVLILRKSTVPY